MYVGADGSSGGEGASYLSNPYVLIGGSILIYWFLKRNSIIKDNPLALRSVKSLEQKRRLEYQTIAKENGVPVKLVEDVAKMNKKDGKKVNQVTKQAATAPAKNSASGPNTALA